MNEAMGVVATPDSKDFCVDLNCGDEVYLRTYVRTYARTLLSIVDAERDRFPLSRPYQQK
jgi:hypothetical protein